MTPSVPSNPSLLPTLGLWYNFQGDRTGPGKVVGNLIKGLEQVGTCRVVPNQEGDYNGCLQGGAPRYLDLPPRTTLMGPNLFLQPKDEPATVGRYQKFVVPSQWVHDLYMGYGNESVVEGKDFQVWSVGIDTDKYAPDPAVSKTEDCLLYVKDRSEKETWEVVEELQTRGLGGKVLVYGRYSPEDLWHAAQASRGAVLLTNTESQGIAYMEILSMGVPCYVYDQPVWQGLCPATSVPYFDTTCCGLKVSGLNHSRLDEFFQTLDNFDPAGYIRRGHTLAQSAQRYLDLATGRTGVSNP